MPLSQVVVLPPAPECWLSRISYSCRNGKVSKLCYNCFLAPVCPGHFSSAVQVSSLDFCLLVEERMDKLLLKSGLCFDTCTVYIESFTSADSRCVMLHIHICGFSQPQIETVSKKLIFFPPFFPKLYCVAV